MNDPIRRRNHLSAPNVLDALQDAICSCGISKNFTPQPPPQLDRVQEGEKAPQEWQTGVFVRTRMLRQ